MSIEVTTEQSESEVKEDSPESTYKPLGFEEMALLLQETNFNSLAIKNWHKAFYTECPSGKGLSTNYLMQFSTYLDPLPLEIPLCHKVYLLP